MKKKAFVILYIDIDIYTDNNWFQKKEKKEIIIKKTRKRKEGVLDFSSFCFEFCCVATNNEM